MELFSRSKGPRTPKTIDYQYRVVKQLGAGMSGEVYHVRRGSEEWALKLLKAAPDQTDTEDWVAAFKFEFSLLKDIQHPNVVAIGDFGWDKELGRLYFTQELIQGVPLHLFLAREDCQDPEVAERLWMQCLDGLEAIHQANALHGDLKPSNILITGGPRNCMAKILDLGVAHPRLQNASGTPAYMPPEKVLRDSVDRRSDLYSIALTFYASLTGVNPFAQGSSIESLKAQTSMVPAPPGSLNPAIRPYLNRILLQLLSKNPRDRPPTAAVVLHEMRLARGESADRVTSIPVVSERWAGRERILDEIAGWAQDLKGLKEAKDFSILVVTGEAGIGKTRLLQEMRYDLELAGHSVRILDVKELRAPHSGDLWLWDADGSAPLDAVLSSVTPNVRGLLIAAPPQAGSEVLEAAKRHSIPCRTTSLSGFTAEDVRKIIEWSSKDPEPPPVLIQGLFEETQGHPARTIHLLAALCEENKLLDPEGRWNLAIFRECGREGGREGGIDLRDLFASASRQLVDDYLSEVGDERPEDRAILLLSKLKERLRANDRESLHPLFDETERVLKKLSDREVRGRLRAELLERKAWAALQEGALEKATAEIEAAKALQNEADRPDPALGLRLQNFEAFIHLRAGRLDQAIRLFQTTHEKWKSLPEDRKVLVVNNDLGAALMQKGQPPDIKEAIRVLTDMLDFFERRKNEAEAIRCHYHLGECHYRIESYKKAIEHYQAVAAGARKLRKWDFLLRAYNGLGNAFNLLNKPKESIDHYLHALDLARYLKDYPAAAAVAQNIGVIERDSGQQDAAGEHLELSLKLLKQAKENTPYVLSLKTRATMELGELARKARDFDRARELLDEARRLVNSEPSLENVAYFVFQNLAQLALDQNRTEDFCTLYPDLLFHAKTTEQKKIVESLRRRSPVDPTQAQVHPAEAEASKPEPAAKPAASRDAASELRALLDINQFLNSERNLSNLLGLVLKYALSLSSAEGGLILLVNPDGRLSLGASLNLDVDEELSQVSRSVAERVLKEGRPIRADNAVEDEAFKEYRSVMLLGLKSIYCAPIRAQKKIVGVLYLIHRFQTSLFQDRIETILQAFADQAGLAIENARLLQSIEEQNRKLEGRVQEAEERVESYEALLKERDRSRRYIYPEIISKSPAMEKVFHLLDRITASNLSTLIQGESGTGKELVARALHQNGPRKGGKFIAINCGALPANLIESELFGYKAGAFTGATRDKRGLLEEANGGTVFLDEIGDLDLTLQVKLLRTLQERSIVRVGDTTPIAIDVRVVSATHRDLRQSIVDGRFREDLFYRIAEIQIDLPPLRERREDIPLLVDHLVKNYAKEAGWKSSPKVSRDLMAAFLAYPWPGNVRELSNRVRVACALAEGKTLQLGDLPEADRRALTETAKNRIGLGPFDSSRGIGGAPEASPAKKTSPSFFKDLLEAGKTWREIENIIFAKALFHHDFDVAKASTELGVGPATLYTRLRRERYRQRRAEFDGYAYSYTGGVTLNEIKKRVFRLASELSDDKPYHAARRLGVSPGMLYRWGNDR